MGGRSKDRTQRIRRTNERIELAKIADAASVAEAAAASAKFFRTYFSCRRREWRQKGKPLRA